MDAGRKHLFPLAEGGTSSTFNLHRIREDADGSVHVCDGVAAHYVIRPDGRIHRTRDCAPGCVFFGLRSRRPEGIGA